MHTFCQHFTESHYLFSIKYWLFSCLFLPPFLFWCLVRHYKFLAIEKMRVSEGKLPLRSWKNAIFKLNLQNLVHIFCQHFTENQSFFSSEILAVIMSISPTFPFFFYHLFMILAIIMSIPLTFPLPNFYKPFFHWREDRSVWGESAPSEADRNNANFKICTGTHRYSDTPKVRQVFSPTRR